MKRHWVFVGGLAVVRIWMVAPMPFAVVPVEHDDLLFVNQAVSLTSGQWLGTYDELTLAKGPFYPMFVATSHAMGIPLRLTQELLYAVFCFVALAALRPLRLSSAALGAIGALLLLDPLTYSATVVGRVIREGIYTALSGLTVAAALGLFLRRGERDRALVGWAALLGVAGAAAWLTREEGAWLLVPVTLFVGAAAWARRRESGGSRRALVVAVLPLLIGLALWLGVAAMNAHRYGWFTVVEWKTTDFRRAYGGLVRLGGGERRYVPVPKEVRRVLYEWSPTFARLREPLEDRPGRGYAAASCAALPASCGDVGGGWFIWLLREAVALDGHYASAERARRFYRDLATEIDALCAQGDVPCHRRRSSIAPPVGPDDVPLLLGSMARGLSSLVRSEGFVADSWSSTGRPWVRQRFAAITGSAVSPAAGGGDPSNAHGRLRARLRASLARLSRWLVPLVAAAGLIGALLECRRARRRPDLDVRIVLLGLFLAVLARLALLAVVDVTSFHAMHSRLLAAVHPLFLLGCALGALRLAGGRTTGPGPGAVLGP